MHGLPRDPQRGISLVESMSALAIVALLAGIAVPTLRASSAGGGPAGFARAIEAQMALARARATATRRQQKLVITADAVFHVEATTEGLGPPVAWRDLHVVVAPRDAEIAALAPTALVAAGAEAPAVGTGLGDALLFSPDGTSSTGTVLVRDAGGGGRFRVALYRTGSSRVLREW
jgi:prepilin-type N-terminal cleavage/methylation domain-containing protein